MLFIFAELMNLKHQSSLKQKDTLREWQILGLCMRSPFRDLLLGHLDVEMDKYFVLSRSEVRAGVFNLGG